MAVILEGSCPPMADVFLLGRECGPVYALLWEAAFWDVRGSCGGTTTWSVKGIANRCGLGKSSVITALKKLLDAGYIQYAGWVWWVNGSKKRRWRVTHPDQLEAVRYAISVMGPPSEKYNEGYELAEASPQEGGEGDVLAGGTGSEKRVAALPEASAIDQQLP